MKKYFLILAIIFLCIGCAMNPSKEDRIQKLETEIKLTTAKVDTLEHTLQTIESAHKQIEIRMNELNNNK